jgi:glycosyltransferase involved in cell wall biosynthesis
MVFSFPKLTLNIAVRNEEKRIATLLTSIANQTYPKSQLEVLIIDGMSIDKTLEIVKAFKENYNIPIRIIKNPKKDSASGRTIGLLNATGDLHLYLDADMELAESTTLVKLVNPFLKEKGITGSFTRFLPHPRDPPLNRFLSYNPFQHDPLFEFLSPDIRSAIHKQGDGYFICYFKEGLVPVIGVVIFPTKLLKDTYFEIKKKWPDWMWSDVDFPIAMVTKGYNKFAYVINTGIYHHSYKNLPTLLRKKKRDITWSYLSTYKQRYATYINLNSKRDIARLLAFVLYSESLFLPFLRGILKSFKYHDPYCILYEPLLSWGITNWILFLLILDPRGRKFIVEVMHSVLSRNLR